MKPFDSWKAFSDSALLNVFGSYAVVCKWERHVWSARTSTRRAHGANRQTSLEEPRTLCSRRIRRGPDEAGGVCLRPTAETHCEVRPDRALGRAGRREVSQTRGAERMRARGRVRERARHLHASSVRAHSANPRAGDEPERLRDRTRVCWALVVVSILLVVGAHVEDIGVEDVAFDELLDAVERRRDARIAGLPR